MFLRRLPPFLRWRRRIFLVCFVFETIGAADNSAANPGVKCVGGGTVRGDAPSDSNRHREAVVEMAQGAAGRPKTYVLPPQRRSSLTG